MYYIFPVHAFLLRLSKRSLGVVLKKLEHFPTREEFRVLGPFLLILKQIRENIRVHCYNIQHGHANERS